MASLKIMTVISTTVINEISSNLNFFARRVSLTLSVLIIGCE